MRQIDDVSMRSRRSRTSRPLMCLTLALLAGALSSCSPGVEPPSQLHAATYEAQGQGGDAALLAGRVSYTGSCLTISTDSGSVLPIFPADEVSADAGRVVFRGQLLRPGDQVSLGGGEGVDLASFREQSIVEIPDTCDVDVPFWVVSQQD